jgi:hypothetical protein
MVTYITFQAPRDPAAQDAGGLGGGRDLRGRRLGAAGDKSEINW